MEKIYIDNFDELDSEQIKNLLDTMENTGFVYTKRVGNHLEIGQAKVELLE